MDDFSPALCQCEAVIDVMYQKQLVYDLLFKTEDILKKFTEEELKHFEYKYFRRKPKTYFLGFDTASRKYFRKQVSLSNRFAALLEKRGITDEVFIKEYLKIDFFRELLVRVKEREENSVKNRPKKREN